MYLSYTSSMLQDAAHPKRFEDLFRFFFVFFFGVLSSSLHNVSPLLGTSSVRGAASGGGKWRGGQRGHCDSCRVPCGQRLAWRSLDFD